MEDTFLIPHPQKQKVNKIDNNHIVVDFEDWKRAIMNRQYEDAFHELCELITFARDVNLLKCQTKTILKKYNLKHKTLYYDRPNKNSFTGEDETSDTDDSGENELFQE